MLKRRDGLCFALRFKSGFAESSEERTLTATVRSSPRVEGLVDLTHATGAKWRNDFVRSKSSSCGKAHPVPGKVGDYIKVLPSVCTLIAACENDVKSAKMILRTHS